MKGDLHTHSYHSDGSNPPLRNFELARNTGLSYLAITDHDYLPAVDCYRPYEQKTGVKAIHGVELSCRDYKRDRRVHILCYLPQDMESIKKICDSTNKNRVDAGLEMAELISQKYPIRVSDIEDVASNSSCIFKQHIMQALMNAGFCTEMFGSLWDELFSFEHGICVRDCISPDVWTVVKEARKAGGVVVMAHPFTYHGIEILGELMNEGLLDGIETRSSKTNPEQEAFLLGLAKTNNLIATGGSDFHGAYAPKIAPIGTRTTDQREIEKIFELSEKIKQGR